MRNTLRIVFFHILLMIMFICGCTKDKNIKQSSDIKNKKTPAIENQNRDMSSSMPIEQIAVYDDPDCVEFVALWSAGDIAKRIGKDKKWVFLNYTVDLWDAPPSYGGGKIIGKLRASSYARIISTMGDDYKVESPDGQIQGWISNEHVKTISKKNPKTRKLCE